MLKYHDKLIKILEKLKPKIRQNIDSILSQGNLKVSYKEDDSVVTQIDLLISDMLKTELSEVFPNVNFYSEEDPSRLDFPLFMLDPVDGTKELAAGRDEWVVSFGLYFSDKLSDKRNFSWIYNPMNGIEISSLMKIDDLKAEYIAPYLVSRTEISEGMHDKLDGAVGMGSIAYKLALLALGATDGVISEKPKHIWDIAAGTHILINLGFTCTANEKPLDHIQIIYDSPIIWKK